MRIPRIPSGLLLAAVLYVALRALILSSAFDRVALWMFELFPMGTMAELHRRGIEFPVRYYYDNAAGQILAGWLAIPSFELFGSTYLALKIVPFALGFGTLLLVWVFLDRNFSRRAATLGALLFAIAPPTLVKYSVICSGNHFENLFFTMLALVCAYELHRAPESRGWLLASAFTAGFALFVFLGALIPVGVLAGMHVGLRGIRRTLRDLLLAVPAFVAGILPLLVLNATTGGRGLGFLGAKFGEESAREHGRVLERIGQYLAVHLPRSGVFEPFAGLPRWLLAAAYFAAFAAAYLVCLPGALRGIAALLRGVVRPGGIDLVRARVVPLVLVLPLSALAFGISNFRIGVYSPPLEIAGYRYFLPVLLFGILAIAVVADRGWGRGGLARIGASAVFAPALVAGLSSFAIVDWGFTHPNLGRYYDGYDLSKLARGLLSARNGIPQAEIVARIESYPPLVRGKVARAVGFNLGVFLIEKKGIEGAFAAVVPELLEAYPEPLWPDLACGAGIAGRFQLAASGRDPAMFDVLAKSSSWLLPAGIREDLIEGACLRNPALPVAGQTGDLLEANHALLVRSLETSTDATLARSIATGQGRFCGRLLRRGIPSDLEHVHAEAQRIRGSAPGCALDFWEGVGAGLVEERETAEIPAELRELPGPEAERAFLGLGCALRRIHRDGAAAEAEVWLRAIGPGARAPLEAGMR